MKVIAKEMVYVNHRRYKEGEEIHLMDREYFIKGKKHILKAEDQFSKVSMAKPGEIDSEVEQVEALGKNAINIPGYNAKGGKAPRKKALQPVE